MFTPVHPVTTPLVIIEQTFTCFCLFYNKQEVSYRYVIICVTATAIG